MPNQNSESLLNEILILVQDMHGTMTNYDRRLSATEKSIGSLEKKLDEVIKEAFIDGDLAKHKSWHTDKSISAWKRFVLRTLT